MFSSRCIHSIAFSLRVFLCLAFLSFLISSFSFRVFCIRLVLFYGIKHAHSIRLKLSFLPSSSCIIDAWRSHFSSSRSANHLFLLSSSTSERKPLCFCRFQPPSVSMRRGHFLCVLSSKVLGNAFLDQQWRDESERGKSSPRPIPCKNLRQIGNGRNETYSTVNRWRSVDQRRTKFDVFEVNKVFHRRVDQISF